MAGRAGFLLPLLAVIVAAEPIDIGRGRLIAHGGGGIAASMACFHCHGLAGEGDEALAAPRLAGRGGYSMAKQMRDYAGGTRPNSIMTPIARTLSGQARVDVTAYYAALPPASGGGDPRDLAGDLGRRLAEDGMPERGLPACGECHGPQGNSQAPAIPTLAGQHASYTAGQLRLWREGRRANDPLGGMTIFSRKLAENEIKAVARWFADGT